MEDRRHLVIAGSSWRFHQELCRLELRLSCRREGLARQPDLLCAPGADRMFVEARQAFVVSAIRGIGAHDEKSFAGLERLVSRPGRKNEDIACCNRPLLPPSRT